MKQKNKLATFFTAQTYLNQRTIFYWFIGICVVTMGSLICFKGDLQKPLDEYFGNGFYVGILSAFAENFVFFGSIGLIAQFVSMKSPADANFEQRIGALANASYVSPLAKKYLVDKSRRLLAFNKTATVTLEIKDIRSGNSEFCVDSKFSNEICNMCSDVDYLLKDTPAEAEGDVLVDNCYGMITHLSLIDEKGKGETIVDDNNSVTLSPAQKSWSSIIPDVKISANGKAFWHFHFWLWGKLSSDKAVENEWYNIIVTRFTADFTIKVINNTNMNIHFDYKYPKYLANDDWELVERSAGLIPKGTFEMKKIILFPNDNFQLFFNNFVIT